jgi:hypothetical protein
MKSLEVLPYGFEFRFLMVGVGLHVPKLSVSPPA